MPFQPATLRPTAELAGKLREVEPAAVPSHAGSPALLTTRGLMQGSPLPMLLWWGPELRPQCNEAYQRLIGQSAAALHPQAWGPQWSEVASHIEQVWATGQPIWHENAPLLLPHAPAGEFCGTYSYNPVHGGAGVEGVLFICSRHYRAGAVHVDGRFGYAAVIHSMDMGFAIVEAIDTPPGELMDYCFVEVNPAWAEQTGLHHVQGKRINEIIKDRREPFWAQTIEQVIATGLAVRATAESAYLGRTLDVYMMRLGGADSRQVAVLVRDITSKTEALNALQRSEQRARAEAERAEAERQRLDAVLEATPVAMFVVDQQGQFIRANSRAREEWGTHPRASSQHWMGWWADGRVHHGQRLDRSDWPLYRALKGEDSREIIEIASPEDARQRKIYVVTGSPIFQQSAGSSHIKGAVVAGMEITDRARAEQALQEAHLRKDEFLAMLAHELRNPLAPIGAAAELMSRPNAGKELMLRTSAIIARQVRHMTGLVDDLLDMSRVSRGAITLDKEFLDTTSVLNDAVEQVTPLLRAKRHRLELEPPSQPLLFEGDRKRVIQVLSNLLNNAIKYTPEGGLIRLSMTQVDEHLEIRIKDNGQGMDGTTLAHAFELFVQAKRSSDRQLGGLGIGLALVKKLVELHGGEVRASSPGLGQGSEFLVRLPTSRSTCPPTSTKAASTKAATRGLQVMVVDDHVDAATTLAMLIESEGYTCCVKHQPEEALVASRQQACDVFVLDIGLPGMDGREMARCLRAQPETGAALLIALSGYAQPEDKKAALSAGFDHYLVKPVDTAQLLNLLAERAASMHQSEGPAH